jgi:hypothetical protein
MSGERLNIKELFVPAINRSLQHADAPRGVEAELIGVLHRKPLPPERRYRPTRYIIPPSAIGLKNRTAVIVDQGGGA